MLNVRSINHKHHPIGFRKNDRYHKIMASLLPITMNKLSIKFLSGLTHASSLLFNMYRTQNYWIGRLFMYFGENGNYVHFGILYLVDSTSYLL